MVYDRAFLGDVGHLRVGDLVALGAPLPRF